MLNFVCDSTPLHDVGQSMATLLTLLAIPFWLDSLSAIDNRKPKACNVFEPQMATRREHFGRQDSGLFQIFKLMASTHGKRLNNINVVV